MAQAAVTLSAASRKARDDRAFAIIDAHHHVWSVARGDYGWLTPALAPIYRDFDLDDYTRVAPAGIAGTVLVQAAPTSAETRYLLDVAHHSDGLVQAVVGHADLDADDAPDALAALARDPLLRSIRPMLQDLSDPRWILRPRVDRALASLVALDLRFDALVKPRELPALLRMLERHPELRVVVDHGGKPAIAIDEWEPWASLVRGIAAHPNACCKLSGLVTEAAPDWRIDALRSYVDHLVACFGTDRILWGSDWPVVELNGGLARWWHATQVLLAPLSPAARAEMMGGNARRFYGRSSTRNPR